MQCHPVVVPAETQITVVLFMYMIHSLSSIHYFACLSNVLLLLLLWLVATWLLDEMKLVTTVGRFVSGMKIGKNIRKVI